MPDSNSTASMQADATVPSLPGAAWGGLEAPGYRLIELIGEGGMGAVFRAEQLNPRREVALKVMRAGLASREVLRRFEREAEVLARLEHPGIARIYEAGTARTGGGETPFFAMEFVRGLPLVEHARQAGLDLRGRLEIMAKVCDAVQFAHQRGIVHRDLKPANILVDAHGQPRVLDFGIARVTESDVRPTTVASELGQLIGTVPYMAPEQTVGDPAEIDTRCDVYALGVVCYELLAGRLPYDLTRRALDEALRAIREEEPTRLSSISRAYRGDVETIVLKALAKEKDRRYDSASELGADLRRFLANEPITARPPSTWYQLSKFTKRNKVLVGGVAATIAALAVGLGLALQQRALAVAGEQRARDALQGEREALAREAQAREEAEQRQREAIAARDAERAAAVAAILAENEANEQRAFAEERSRAAQEAAAAASAAAVRAERNAYVALVSAAELSLRDGESRRARRLLEQTSPAARGPEFSIVRSRVDSWLWAIRSSDGAPRLMAVAPLPGWGAVLVGYADGRCDLVSTAGGAVLRTLREPGGTVRSLDVSADGRLAAIGLYGGGVEVRDISSGAVVARLRPEGRHADLVRFGPGGAWLLSSAHDGLCVHAIDDGRVLGRLTEKPVARANMKMSVDGSLLALRMGEKLVAHRLPQGEQAWSYAPAGSSLWALAFVQGGASIVAGSGDDLLVLDPQTGAVRERFAGAGGWGPRQSSGPTEQTMVGGPLMSGQVISPGGSMAADVGWDGSIRVQSLAASPAVALWQRAVGAVVAMEFGADERALAVLCDDGRVLVLDAASGVPRMQAAWDGPALGGAVMLSPDARFVLARVDAGLLAWRTDKPAAVRELPSVVRLHLLGLTPDGGRLLTADQHWRLTLWDTRSLSPVETFDAFQPGDDSVSLSPSGQRVAYTSPDLRIEIRDTQTGELVVRTRPVGGTRVLAWAKDENQLVVADHTSKFTIDLRFAHGGPPNQEPGAGFADGRPQEGTRLVATSRDGALTATYTISFEQRPSHTARRVDGPVIEGAGPQSVRVSLEGQENLREVSAMTFSADGGRLFVGLRDGTLRVIDVSTGEQLLAVPAHQTAVVRLLASPDGARLYSGSSDGAVHVWETGLRE